MKKGTIWIISGLLLIAAAFGLTVYNLFDQNRAGIRTQKVMTQIIPELEERSAAALERTAESEKTYADLPFLQTEVPDYVLNPNMDMPKQEIDGINYVGILSVPELGLELPVADEWSYANLKTAPCRFFGSAYRGNLVICAHNYLNHFGTLRNLTIGAQIAFTDMDGNMFRYTVAELETLLPTEVEQMKNGDWALTLFTCTVGGRTRLTVRCLAADNI